MCLDKDIGSCPALYKRNRSLVVNFNNSFANQTPTKGKNIPNDTMSVLDDLENYWQEHDRISATNSDQFGIMARQAEDMMLLSSNSKNNKRSGAFCVGIWLS